jgi:hypothetical protein
LPETHRRLDESRRSYTVAAMLSCLPPIGRALLLPAVGLALGGCAGATGVDPDSVGCRAQVRTATDWPDADSLARRLGDASGRPVVASGLAVIGPRWYAVSLAARGRDACRQALDRLAADRTLALEVLPDTARRRPPPPDRTSAR